MTYLVELGPCRRGRRDGADPAVAAAVARRFGPRQGPRRRATPSSLEALEALARRRLGLVRLTRPE